MINRAKLRAPILLLAIVVARVASAESVAIIAASDESLEAARLVRAQIDDPTVHRVSGSARDLDALVLQARLDWDEALIVIVDAERNKVSVVRSSDGTIGSRILDPEASREPYALALAAVELLDILRSAPTARAAALPPRDRATAAEKRNPARLELTLGAVNSAGPHGAIMLIQPSIALGVSSHPHGRGPHGGAWSIGAEIEAAGFSSQSSPYVHSLPTGVDGGATLAYSRSTLALRALSGFDGDVVHVSGYGEFGLARIRVALRDSDQVSVAEYRRLAPWFGGGLQLSSHLSKHWALAFAAGLAVFPTAADATARVVAFKEETFELKTRLGLTWGAEL